MGFMDGPPLTPEQREQIEAARALWLWLCSLDKQK